MRPAATASMLIASLALAGCLEEFDPASSIERARILGTRAEIEGDEGRAWPRPGERVELPWLVVFPGEAQEIESLFLVCVAAPTSFGVGFCDGDPLPTGACEGRGDTPCVSFEVPEPERLGDSSQLLVLGGICADGMPTVDPEEPSFECRGEGAEGDPVTFTLPVQRGDATNTHPGFAEIRFDDAVWEPLPAELLGASTEGCPEDDAIPTVSASETEHEIAITMTPESFETFTVEEENGREAMRTEEMEVSSFTTAGELERQRTVIEADATEPSTLEWTAPEAADVPDDGRLVRLHFVARDGRAGLTSTHRGICVR